MANVYIKTAEGGETTNPAGTEGIPLDDGGNSTWISINNIAEYIRTLTQTLTNKTLTTPTIASFTNAQHDHSGASSGGVASYPPGFLYGLTLSNNVSDATNDIDIAAGKCRDSTDAANLILSASLTKRLDAAWAVGTNQGGLDTGSIADTTYHIWLIKRSDTGVVDALFSTSASAPTMPANYDYKRRIGSIVRTGAAIKAFIQDGDDFAWVVPVQDVIVTNPGTSAVTRTLTLPTGIRVKAEITFYGVGVTVAGNPQSMFASDLSIADTAPTIAALNMMVYTDATNTNMASVVNVYTNTSAQIRTRIQSSTAATNLIIVTLGWKDPRGRA